MIINEVILKEMLDDVERNLGLSKNAFERYEVSKDKKSKSEYDSTEYRVAATEAKAREHYMLWRISQLIKYADVLKSYTSNFDLEDEE